MLPILLEGPSAVRTAVPFEFNFLLYAIIILMLIFLIVIMGKLGKTNKQLAAIYEAMDKPKKTPAKSNMQTNGKFAITQLVVELSTEEQYKVIGIVDDSHVIIKKSGMTEGKAVANDEICDFNKYWENKK